jgi:Flp pilus assembly protein TadG
MSATDEDRTRIQGEAGAALAEFGVVLPILLALLLVIFDFGQGFLAYISVTDGARDGARAALQDGKGCTKADLEPSARNAASPYSDASFAVVVKQQGSDCEVTVSYRYTPILPFVTSAFDLPGIGTVGPLWDGWMTETMVSG